MLNWLLITMMLMLPLRGALADNQTACQMHDEPYQEIVDHGMHVVPEAAQLGAAVFHDCCSDDEIACNSDCGMGMSVSFILQSIIDVPVLNKALPQTCVNNILVLRELPPPTRPPAYL